MELAHRAATAAGRPGILAADAYGRRLAAALTGAWRPVPPPVAMSAEALEELTAGLLRSGTGALAWWRLRRVPLGASAPAAQLRQHYHLHALEAALHERDLVRVVTRLRSAGLEPVVVKGSAVARLYPEPGLRPFGDLDLCVRPDQYAMAAASVRNWSDWRGRLSPIDLHRGFARLDTRSWDDLCARSRLMPIGGIDVRVLGPEDHLRLLCLHLLRHGVLSPLALCDVAVALESRSPDFDWDRSLGPDRRRADWMACTIGLAHQLLGARVNDTPVAARAGRLPGWLVPSVVRQWERYYAVVAADLQARPDAPWTPLGRVAAGFMRNWPSPVAATIHLRGPFNAFPRLPIQVLDATGRLVRFAYRRVIGRQPGFTSPH